MSNSNLSSAIQSTRSDGFFSDYENRMAKNARAEDQATTPEDQKQFRLNFTEFAMKLFVSRPVAAVRHVHARVCQTRGQPNEGDYISLRELLIDDYGKDQGLFPAKRLARLCVQDIEQNGGNRTVANDHYLHLYSQWIKQESLELPRDKYVVAMMEQVFARQEYGPKYQEAEREFMALEKDDPKGAAALRAFKRQSTSWAHIP